MKPKKKRNQRAPDGAVYCGDRLVRKGGVIKYAGSQWQDDRLIPFIGQILGVRSEDYWIGTIHIYWPTYPDGDLILSLGDKDYATTAYDRVLSELNTRKEGKRRE